MRDVAEIGSKREMSIERSEVVSALEGLIAEGLAKAYLLSASAGDPFAGELLGMPPMEGIEEDFKTYFYITEKGLELYRSYDDWLPCDDEGKPY